MSNFEFNESLLTRIARFLLIAIMGINSANASEIKNLNQGHGACLGVIMLAGQSGGAITSAAAGYHDRQKVRLKRTMDKFRPCMNGKADTPDNVQNCAKQYLNGADYDFYSGFDFSLTNFGNVINRKNSSNYMMEYCFFNGELLFNK